MGASRNPLVPATPSGRAPDLWRHMSVRTHVQSLRPYRHRATWSVERRGLDAWPSGSLRPVDATRHPRPASLTPGLMDLLDGDPNVHPSHRGIRSGHVEMQAGSVLYSWGHDELKLVRQQPRAAAGARSA